MLRRALRDLFRFYARDWWYIALVQLVAGMAVAVPLYLVVQITAAVVAGLGPSFPTSDAVGPVTMLLFVLAFVVTVPMTMVGIGTTVRVVNDSLAGRRRRLGAALLASARRIPAILASAAIAAFGTIALVVLSPVLTAVGIVALAAAAVVVLLRRKRPEFAARWPRVEVLAWVAFPFALALRFLGVSMLAIPAVVLEGAGPLAALRTAEEAIRPRRLAVPALIVAAVAVSFSVQAGIAGLGSLVSEGPGTLAAQVLAQLFIIGLPIIAITILFRLGRAKSSIGSMPASPTAPYATADSQLPRRHRARPAGVAAPVVIQRVALALPFILIATAVGVAPTAAQAAPSTVVITVTTAADPTDAGEIATQVSQCESGTGTCSLRAALGYASKAASRAGTTAVSVGFSDSFSIALAGSPVTFVDSSVGGPGEQPGGDTPPETPGETGGEAPLPGPGQETPQGETPTETPSGETGGEGTRGGTVTIDGGTAGVTIDAGGRSQGIAFQSNSWGLALKNLRISNGDVTGEDALGGGLGLISPAASSIERVVFDGNTAAVGGGAVSVMNGSLTVVNSTFVGNTATQNNSTGYVNGGSDIDALYTAQVTVKNSTFAAYFGSSLLSSGGSTGFTVSNSLFDVRGRAGGVTACNGRGFAGDGNVVVGPDTSCPDWMTTSGPVLADLAVPRGGGLPVMALVQRPGNEAIGAGGKGATLCLPVDARGKPRPEVGCDVGAARLDSSTTTTLTSSSPSVDFGTAVTFTASIALSDAAQTVDTGTVVFTVDGIQLGEPVAVRGGQASTATTFRDDSGTRKIVATYIPADATVISGSTSVELSQEVIAALSATRVASSANPSQAGDASTIVVTVAANNPSVPVTGSVTLFDRTAGSPGDSLGTQTVQGGQASFTIAQLTPGRHKLVAVYSGDEGNSASESAVFEQVVQNSSIPVITLDKSTADFGAPIEVEVTVPTTAGLPVATGTVRIAWKSFSDEVSLDGSGVARLTVTTIEPGTSDITASYRGDDNYSAAEATASPVTITAAATTTVLTIPTSLVYGQPTTFTAAVTRVGGSAPVGRVEFRAGSTVLGTADVAPGAPGREATSTASFTPTAAQLAVGTHSFTARFVPAAGFIESTSSASGLQVAPAPTTTALTSSDPRATVGTPVSLTATVTSGGESVTVPTGDVEFFAGTVSLGTAKLDSGVATLSTVFWTAGERNLTARFAGDPTLTGSTSAAARQDTASEPTTTTLSVSPTTSSRYGEALRLTATVVGSGNGLSGTGTVVLTDDGVEIGRVPLARGAATTIIAVPPGGAHTYVGTFVPANTDFLGSSSRGVPHSVTAASTSTTLGISTDQPVAGDTVRLTATVSTPDIAGEGTVTFLAPYGELGTTTLVGGVATLDTPLRSSVFLPQGELRIVARYDPASADFNPSSASRAASVARAVTKMDLRFSGSAGEPQSLQAVFSMVSGMGTPGGTVTFTTTDGRYLGSAPVVDGVASAPPFSLPSNGTKFRAVWEGSTTEITMAEPARAGLSVNIGPGRPTITVTADTIGPVTFGSRVGLTATMEIAGVAPAGTVFFTATTGSVVTHLGTVSPSELVRISPIASRYVARIDTTKIPTGTAVITADYSGDPGPGSVNLLGATSTGITQEVGRTATTLTLSHDPFRPTAGSPVKLFASVAATGTVVGSGTIEFFHGGVSLGTSAVNGTGNAQIAFTPSVRGDLPVTAVYSSPSGDFVGSTSSATIPVDGVRTTLELVSLTPTPIVGQPSRYRISLDGRALPTGRPGGPVTVRDGSGNSCVVTPSFDAGQGRASGECALTWTTTTATNVWASYAGDAVYAGSTSNIVLVEPTQRGVSLSITAPGPIISGRANTIEWAVTGPVRGGTVTITGPGGVICTSVETSGSCDFRPTGGTSVSLRIDYVGTDALWQQTSRSVTFPVTVCVPRGGIFASPTQGGTVTTVTAPNCNGDGYQPGTPVEFAAVPAPGFAFVSWGTPTSGFPSDYPSSFVTAVDSPVTQTAYFTEQCVDVTFRSLGGDPGAQTLTNGVNPGCRGWTGSTADSRTGSFLVGQAFTTNVTAPPVGVDGIEKAFNGWADGAVSSADTLNAKRTYTVTGTPGQELLGLFGVGCVHDIRVVDAPGGTVSIDGPRCSDARGEGFPLGAQLSVSARATGESYFTGWSTNKIRVATTTATSSTGTVKVERTNPAIAAGFDGCVSLTLSVTGRPKSGGFESTATATPSGNCPNKGPGWYTRDSTVQLDTQGMKGTSFGGWTSDLEIVGSTIGRQTAVKVTKSGSASVKWFSTAGCVPFTVRANPAQFLSVSAALAPGNDSACPQGQLDTALSVPTQTLTLTAKANGGDPLIGWTGVSTRIDANSLEQPVKLGATASAVRTVDTASGGTFDAWACQAIDITLTLVSPDGTKNTAPLPSGTDFVAAAPAPDCPLGRSAYTLGQTVFPQALGVDAGHTFVGWSGAVDSTDVYPAQGITIDGASKTIPLTATYQVKCFKLTTNSTSQIMDTPNCPNTPASESMFVGGTTVSLLTPGNGGGSAKFRGWQGDLDGQDGSYAWVTLTKNSSVTSYYSSPSAGEAISDAASTVGNAVAIAAKKAVGIAAAAVSAIVMGGNPLATAASLVVLLGQGVAAIAKLGGWDSVGLQSFNRGISSLSQVVTWMQSSAMCGSVWAANGSTKTVDDLEETSAKKVGEYASKAHKAKQEAAAALKAQQAAQLAAADAANDSMAAWKWASTADSGTMTVKAGTAATGTASSASAKAKAALGKASRLGDVAMVGYAVYNDYQTGAAGWDSSAEAAWTTGGDVYMQCMDSAVPDFIKTYDGK